MRDPQDELREIMLLGIAPQFLKPSLRPGAAKTATVDMRAKGLKGIEIISANAARRRAEMAPRVLELRKQGMALDAISKQVGTSRETVRKIIMEAEAGA